VVPLAAIGGLFALLYYSEQFRRLAAVSTYLLAYSDRAGSGGVTAMIAPLGVSGTALLNGAYLLHFRRSESATWCSAANSTTAGLLAACVCLALTVPAAELLYRTIERLEQYGRQAAEPNKIRSVP